MACFWKMLPMLVFICWILFWFFCFRFSISSFMLVNWYKFHVQVFYTQWFLSISLLIHSKKLGIIETKQICFYIKKSIFMWNQIYTLYILKQSNYCAWLYTQYKWKFVKTKSEYNLRSAYPELYIVHCIPECSRQMLTSKTINTYCPRREWTCLEISLDARQKHFLQNVANVSKQISL